MVKQKPVIVILFILLIGVAVFFLIYPSEERQVRKRFNAFAETTTVQADENPLIVASKCRKISMFFAPVCRIEADEYNVARTLSQDNIYTIAVRVLSRHKEFKLTFVDLHVDIIEKGVAETVSTAHIIGRIKGDEAYVEENHEVECRLEKIDDEWVFVQMRVIDVLEK